MRHVPAVALFVGTMIVLLATDLVVKSVAFERVAGAPVTLERASPDDSIRIPSHESRTIVPSVLALHLTVNEGAVFGLGQGGRWAFVIFSVIASIAIATVFARSRPDAWVLHFALASVLAGAIGNLYDRLVYGLVRDMLLLFPGVRLPFGWRWPDGSDGLYPWIFNVADVCLVVGLIVLMIIMYRQDRALARADKEQQASVG